MARTAQKQRNVALRLQKKRAASSRDTYKSQQGMEGQRTKRGSIRGAFGPRRREAHLAGISSRQYRRTQKVTK
jgi:hypothetical protein